jgi:hypothetical protein
VGATSTPPASAWVVSSGGAFTAIDFPGATGTAAARINTDDIVQNMVGCNRIARLSVVACSPHQLRSPPAPPPSSDTGEILNFYSDASGNTRLSTPAAFSTVDVTGARGITDTYQNGGPVTGVFTDALNEQHGLTGQ